MLRVFSTEAENHCIFFALFAIFPGHFPSAGDPLAQANGAGPYMQLFEARCGIDAVASALYNDARVDTQETWKTSRPNLAPEPSARKSQISFSPAAPARTQNFGDFGDFAWPFH